MNASASAIVPLASRSWRGPWTSGEVRAAFLSAATYVERAVADPRVAGAWDRPSALAGMSVGALAAHLSRGVFVVGDYLRGEAPEEPVYDAPGYFAVLTALTEPDSELNKQVSARAADAAATGPAAVREALRRAVAELPSLLGDESVARTIAVIGGMALTLDEYLCTRLVELSVHLDDLAVSLGDAGADLPADAATLARLVCAEIATRRDGPLAVLRAMTRAERGTGSDRPVLPVF